MQKFNIPLIAIIMLILGAPPFMALAGPQGFFYQVSLIISWAFAVGALLMIVNNTRGEH